ncbi:MAG: 4-aminobutyrate--2-oxoglutarate transaminase [Gammaproteobacteria bacterium]|nr:4-aminobutyrate--2-oxoglutarate transaminase [Gammaproteobacteria bacterium]
MHANSENQTMSNAELLERRQAAVPHGVASATPLFVEKALNAELWDADGKRYLDFAQGIAVCNTGHCHPKVMAAAKVQCEKYTHTAFQVVQYEPYVRLAERLNRIAPIEDAKTLFFSTGAEAVENAVKIARIHTGRSGVIAFNGAFHGRTALTMGLTGKIVPYKGGAGVHPQGIFHAPFPVPHHGISVQDALLGIETILKVDIEAKDVAAILIEPVQGEGGFYAAPQEFMEALRRICDEKGMLLIADEIQSGIGRTGKMYAMEHYGIEPDILTTAKALAGGFPVSGVIGKRSVMDSVAPGGLGGTYGGNPVAIAAAHAVLDIFETEDLCGASARNGEYMIERLNGFKNNGQCGHIGNVRGIGSMVAFEMVNGDGNTPDPAAAAAAMTKARELGLILLVCGYWGNTLRILTPLTVPREHLEEGMNILEQTLIAVSED